MQLSSSFTVACAQIDCKLGDVKSNLATIRSIADKISRVKPRPDFVCFPELATTGYLLGSRWRKLGEVIPGESTDELSKIASENGFYLICGIDERDEDRIYDSAVLIDPNGNLSGKFRKVHLWGSERKFFARGDSFPVFKTRFCSIGIGICYDLEFPESARSMAKKGAKIVFFPSAEFSPVEKQINSFIMSRSAENCVFVAFSNRIGREGSLSFFGQSQIASPDARTVIAGESRSFVSAKVDLKLLDSMSKKLLPYLAELEPAAYI